MSSVGWVKGVCMRIGFWLISYSMGFRSAVILSRNGTDATAIVLTKNQEMFDYHFQPMEKESV